MTVLLMVIAVGVALVVLVRSLESRMLFYPHRAHEATPASLGWAFGELPGQPARIVTRLAMAHGRWRA